MRGGDKGELLHIRTEGVKYWLLSLFPPLFFFHVLQNIFAPLGSHFLLYRYWSLSIEYMAESERYSMRC